MLGRSYGAAGKTCSITARHGRCRRGKIWFIDPVSKTTFVGTLISGMSFGTVTAQLVSVFNLPMQSFEKETFLGDGCEPALSQLLPQLPAMGIS
jgi:hypothetical protein